MILQILHHMKTQRFIEATDVDVLLKDSRSTIMTFYGLADNLYGLTAQHAKNE